MPSPARPRLVGTDATNHGRLNRHEREGCDVRNDKKARTTPLRVGILTGLLFIAASSYLTYRDGGDSVSLGLSILAAIGALLALPGKRT